MQLTKILVSMLFIVFLGACNNGEKVKVPEQTKKAFQEHANVNNAEWEKENDTYMAEYQENGIDKEIKFDGNGNMLATIQEIDKEKLDPAVKDYISKNYVNHSIAEAEKGKKKSGKTFYEVEIKSNKKTIDLTFNSKVELIAKEKTQKKAEESKDTTTVVIPDKVKTAFKNQHPDSIKVEWEKEDSIYEAEYKEKGIVKEVEYDSIGNVTATEKELDTAKVHPLIKNYVNKNYSNFDIEKAEKGENKNGIFHEVEISNKNKALELTLKTKTEFVKEETEEKEEETEEEET